MQRRLIGIGSALAIGAFLIQPSGYGLVERHAPDWLVDRDIGTHCLCVQRLVNGESLRTIVVGIRIECITARSSLPFGLSLILCHMSCADKWAGRICFKENLFLAGIEVHIVEDYPVVSFSCTILHTALVHMN